MADVPAPPPTLPRWLLILGGRKFAAMVAGLVASVAVAFIAAAAVKAGFPLSPETVGFIEAAIAAKVGALIIGQAMVDSKTGGGTFPSPAAPTTLADAKKELGE